MPIQHAKIGGSVSGRIIQCPWFLANLDRAPVETSQNDAALEGTALHNLMEAYYQDEIDSIEGELGKTRDNIEMTQDRIDRALDASRALDNYCDDLEEEIGELCEVHFERHVKFNLGTDLDHHEAYGTCDILLRCGYVLGVLDYKFGRQVVPVEENPQLLFYADAARTTFPEEYGNCTHVEMSIIQPASDNLIDTWKTTPERLEEYADTLCDAVEKAESLTRISKQGIDNGSHTNSWTAAYEALSDSLCNMGKYCQWCPLEFVCPKKRAQAAVALDFTIPEKNSLSKKEVDDLAYWMDQASALESFASAIRSKVQGLLDKNVKVPGWKLVERRANRVWVDEDAAKAFAKKEKIKATQYNVVKFVTPAQMEKLIGKKTPIPETLIARRSSGHTVAPMTDKRIDLNAGQFAALKDLPKQNNHK